MSACAWQAAPRSRDGASAPWTRSPGEDRPDADRPVVCADCGHAVTSASAAIEVAGRHRHTCVNPAGIVYRIRCFACAPGARAEGVPTAYYSWFAGFSWRILVCGGCGAHLGWAFCGAPEQADFAGLIADHIAERE